MLREILNAARLRIRALVHRRRLERDLQDELAFHVAMRAGKLRDAGLDDSAAAVVAEKRFGNTMRWRERCRGVWTLEPLERFVQDLRYGARMLRRSPSFTATVVATLAVGVGVTTAGLAVLDLRPLPVPRPDELVLLHWTTQTQPDFVSVTTATGCENEGVDSDGCVVPYPLYARFAEHARSFAGLAAYSNPIDLQVRHGDTTELAAAHFTSGNYFAVLGVPPAHGRALVATDDEPGAAPVAVLGDRYWRSRFGADPAILGRAVVVNGTPVTVVGVAPPGFFGLDATHPPALWMPVQAAPQLDDHAMMRLLPMLTEPKGGLLAVVGRLRSDVSRAQAEAEMPAALRAALAEVPDTGIRAEHRPRVLLQPAAHGVNNLRVSYGRILGLVRWLVALVMMVACANVANLLLARAAARRREVGVRVALGAGRLRIVRQMLTEGLLLASLGTGLGLLLGLAGSRILGMVLVPGLEPAAFAWSRPSAAVLALAAGLCTATTLLFGLVPAWATRRVTPAHDLRVGGSGSKGSVGAALGRWIVGFEVAVALLVLVAAGLLGRSIAAFSSFDPGFRTAGLLTVQTAAPLGLSGPPDPAPDVVTVRSRLAALPGVTSASWASQPLLGMSKMTSIAFRGPMENNDHFQVEWLSVGPRFFETVGIPVLSGPDVEEDDTGKQAGRLWINRTLADRLPPEEARVGALFRFGMCPECTIAGVVGDAHNSDVRQPIGPTVYMPQPASAQSFLLRTAVPPRTLSDAARRAVNEAAPSRLVHYVRDEAAFLAAGTRTERLLAGVAATTGALVLALAAVGIYGVLAYSVTRRTSELAVRMALGAARSDVLRLVLREGLGIVGAGAAVGLLAALGCVRFVKAFLFQVDPLDPIAFASATLVLLAVATLAAYRPAARATRVDPLVALRAE
jgi:macrolide transport system ATP-binding/permease protein